MQTLEEIINYSSYYINLDVREDKNELLIKHFIDSGLPVPKRVSAVEAFRGMTKNDDWLKDEEKCRLAAQASTASHLLAIEDAYKRNAKYALIFEDDAFFLPNGVATVNKCLQQLFTQIDDWDIYWLGGHLGGSNEFVTTNLLKGVLCFCSHAYLINEKRFEYVLDNRENIDFIDIFLGKLPKNFISYPACVVQREDVTSDLAAGRPNMTVSFWEKQYDRIKVQ